MNLITRLSTEVPAVQVPTDFLKISDGGTLSAGNSPVSESIPNQYNQPWSPKQRRNATRTDLLARYGGGGYAVCRGLEFSASNLNLTISPGHAVIDGIVEVAEGLSVGVSDSVEWVHIWLSHTGTVFTVNNSPLPPLANLCYLGAVKTSGNVVTQFDYSGVMYIRGGILYRETADPGFPKDSPPGNVVFIHKTRGGRYLWDGTAYHALSAAMETVLESTESLTEEVEELGRKFRGLLYYLTLTLGADWLPDKFECDFELSVSER